MTPVGETLRRERLKRHLELDQISQELKISRRMLEAIEEEEFDRLPGGVFTKSFVLQYAKVLGLDQEELANQVQQLVNPRAEAFLAESSDPAAASIHVPKVEEWDYNEKSFSWGSWMPAAALVIVAMLACSGIYGWWQRYRHSGLDRTEPATASAQAPEPATQPAPQPAEIQPAQPAPPAATQQAPAATQTPANQQNATPPASTTPETAAPTQPTQPPGQVNGEVNPDAAVRVALTAEEPVWVSARADGKQLYSVLLNPNETRTIEAKENVVVRLGNAGGITVTLNGQPVGTLGAKGQARTVQFTPGGFQIVAAPPKPSLPL